MGSQREWRCGIDAGRWPDGKLSLAETACHRPTLDPALRRSRLPRGHLPDGDGGRRDRLVLARSARRHSARRRFTFRRGSRASSASGRFEIRVDRAFEAVMRACAERGRRRRAPGSARRSSSATSRCTGSASRTRSRPGASGELVGGLYGVHLGGAFFGESMFHRVTDASKVALVALVDRLRAPRLPAARHPVGDAASRAVRRDRDPRRSTGR